jgi:TP901 family phage tail tape measure protein
VNAFSIFGRMSLDDSDYQRGLRSAEGETKKAADRMATDWKKVGEAAQTVGKALSLTLTAPIVAFGATAIRAAADFESSMNKVRGITQATGDDFQRLEALAKDLGASTQFSASQAADAMGFLAMAGFDVDDIMSSLPGVLELAAAGNIDLARAADIASNVLSGFGLEAGEVARVNDVLALASISANTNVEQLGNAFKFVAPVAAALGVSVEESAAAIGIMSDAGIQGEMAGTALRNILGQLAKESDELGINVYDLNGQMLPLADIIEQLEVRGLNTAEAMGEFGQRAGPALQALLSRGSGALRDLTGNLEDAGGTAARLATTNMEGFNGAVLNLRSAIEGLQIAIAQSGLLAFFQGLIERLTGVIRYLSTLNPQLLQVITILAGLAAAVGPVLLVFGTLLLQIPKITAALAVLRTAMLAFTGPVGLFLLAATGVGFLIAKLVGRDSFSESVDKAVEKSKQLSNQLANANDDNSVLSAAMKLADYVGPKNSPARAAFVAFAAEAMNSSDSAVEAFETIKAKAIELGAEIGDFATPSSLVNSVAELANFVGPAGSPARIAFVNFANEIIATSETAQDAFAIIRREAFEAANAVELAQLRTRRAQLAFESTVADFIDDPTERIQSLTGSIADYDREIARLQATMQAARDAGNAADEAAAEISLRAAESARAGIQAALNEANLALENFDPARQRQRSNAAAQQLADIDAKIAALTGSVVENARATDTVTRTVAGTLTPALTGAGDAAGGATEEFNLLTIAGLDAAIAAARLKQRLAETAEERFDLALQIGQLEKMRDAIIAAFSERNIPVPGIVAGIGDIGTAASDATAELNLLSLASIDAAIAAARLGFNLAETKEERLDFSINIAELEALREAMLAAVAPRDITPNIVVTVDDTLQRIAAAHVAYQQSRAQSDREFRRAQEHEAEMQRRAEQDAELTALREQGERLLAAQREYQTSRVQGDREFRRAQEHAAEMQRRAAQQEELTALREQGERLVAAQREYQASRIQGDREFRRAQEHAAEMNRRAELEAEEARRKELEDRERAHVAAMISQSNLLRYARLEASAQARTVAQDDLAFTLSMVERSFGPIQSLDEAWRAFAQYGLTMTADMLMFLQEKFAVVEVSAEDLAQANLDLATANLKAVQAAQRLGEATEDDVNAALVRQAQALIALRGQLDPTTARWAAATDQLADLYDGLRTNETALLDQMSRVQENSLEYAELAAQLERVRALMYELGLVAGSPASGITEVAEGIVTGVEAIKRVIEVLGPALGTFNGHLGTLGVAVVEVANKFPLFGSALEGYSITLNEYGQIIDSSFDPVKAVTAVFLELLNKSESFQALLQMVNERLAPLAERIIEPLVRVLGTLLEAVFPVIEILVNLIEIGLKPFLFIFTNVLGPLLTGLANTIRNVWNAFAAVIPGMKKIKDPKKVDKQGPRVLTVTEGGAQYAGLTIRMDTIAGQEQMLQAAREFERTATTQRDRDLIRAEIERRQSAIASMRGAPDPNTIAAPTPPGGKEPPEVVVPPPAGSIEALRAEATALNAERARTTDPARLAEINNRLFDINLEVRRLEAIGMPRDEVTAPPTTPRAPAGSIAALEEERRALQEQLRVASESEIPELNTRIAALNEEINRLQRLGLGGDLAQEIGETIEKAAFGATPQSVQLAVATPLVEASYRMLDAADVMNRVFGSMMPGSESGFGALPPFTSAIERMTPVLERLLEEGVSVMMGQRGDTGPMSSPTAFLRGV